LEGKHLRGWVLGIIMRLTHLWWSGWREKGYVEAVHWW